MCLAVSERDLTRNRETSTLTAVDHSPVCMGSVVSAIDEHCTGCHGGTDNGNHSADPSAVSTASTSTAGLSSGGGGSGSGWRWLGPPGEHSPYPVDVVPYAGPQLLYCFVDIMTSYKIMSKQATLHVACLGTIKRCIYGNARNK